MNNYKNHHKRNRFKSNGDRNFRKRNVNGHKINGDFNGGADFKRRNPGRNNQNAAKLIEKYNELAREALSNGDKILSENYLQHADHFSRIIIYQESLKVKNSDIIQPDNKDLNNKSEKDTSENEKNTDKSNIID